MSRLIQSMKLVLGIKFIKRLDTTSSLARMPKSLVNSEDELFKLTK